MYIYIYIYIHISRAGIFCRETLRRQKKMLVSVRLGESLPAKNPRAYISVVIYNYLQYI